MLVKINLLHFMTSIIQKIFKTIGIATFVASFSLYEATAQSYPDSDSLLIAQKLGTIESKIDVSEVPNIVLSSAIAASGSKPTSAQIQINPDGSTVYELLGQNQQGFDFEIEINPNGQIIEIDEQIEPSAVPQEVMKVLKYWLPDAQIVSTWRSTRYKSFDYFYEIVINNDFWVEIPADGKTLKISPL